MVNPFAVKDNTISSIPVSPQELLYHLRLKRGIRVPRTSTSTGHDLLAGAIAARISEFSERFG